MAKVKLAGATSCVQNGLSPRATEFLRFWNNEVSQNIHSVMDAVYIALYGAREAEPRALKHKRHTRTARIGAVTPPRRATRADPPPPGEGEE